VPYTNEFFERLPRRRDIGRVSVAKLARAYVGAVRERQPRGPYRLLGFSFGGLLAYEMAHQLERAGEQVSMLVMLDIWLPDAIRRNRGRTILRHLRRTLLTIPFDAPDAASRVHRLHLRALDRYRVPSYAGSALLVRAQDSLRALAHELADPSYGWQRHVGRLDICDVPGDHTGILERPNAAELADAVRGQLAAA
jgi:thioesterase domain-containing protein